MARGPTRFAKAGVDVMFATIVNLTNVFEIAIALFGLWYNKMFDFDSHQWCVNLYPGVRVNLPRIWGRLTQVERCHIIYNTQHSTILVIFFNAYVCKWGRLTQVERCHIIYNTTHCTILLTFFNAYVCK